MKKTTEGFLRRRRVLGILSCVLLAGLMFSGVSCTARQEGDTGGEEEATTGGQGPPPALVAVAEAKKGRFQPTAEYVGTVFYSQVSDVASEVEGKVQSADYEEGRRVKEGQVLVKLSPDLVDTAIKSTRSSYEQALEELEKAEKDLGRMWPLFKEGTISESLHDEHLYRSRAARKKADGLRADLERLELEKTKMSIRAPFGGLVVSKVVEEGEWVPSGGAVAVIANDREVDAVVDVPEEMLGFLKPGRKVQIKSGGRKLIGRFISFVPRGDVATRTFSIKIRLKNTAGLIEGMEARAVLPLAPESELLIVPRDAVINRFGQDVVFTVNGAVARMVPVRVTGYEGLTAGVEGPGLSEGVRVVVKGNERVMDGQPVSIINSGAGGDTAKKPD